MTKMLKKLEEIKAETWPKDFTWLKICHNGGSFPTFFVKGYSFFKEKTRFDKKISKTK